MASAGLRLYDLELHVWVRLDGDEALLWMTDIAQTMGTRRFPGRQSTAGTGPTPWPTVAVVE